VNTVASEPAVELTDVRKTYRETVALDGVSFAVEPGEFFTLVGPSGCGKTTTLRLIGGFEQPTSGTVRFGGRDVSGLPPEDRDVGVVFQNYALFPHMTVGENIAYGLNFSEPPGDVTDDERVSELLELVDLAGMEDRDPAALSGGQKQRIAMARALAPGPEILLLDEPMSALDAQLRERLRIQIREIQQELGITTIYVTHDQEEALAISDRVAVVNDGSIEQIGTPEQIYDEPETQFVAEFIGDNNVFTGQITAMDGTVTVDLGEETVEVAQTGRLDGSIVGDQVCFCVRPEDFVVGQVRNSIRATVESAEFLGDRTRVHLGWGGRELLALTDRSLDGEVSLGFEPADAHIIPQ
jgi:thiamine transport system ATP-binding protein